MIAPALLLTHLAGWAITRIPEGTWENAIGPRGAVRERRAYDTGTGTGCAHHRCWIEEAHVTELTGLLRQGRLGTSSPAGRRHSGLRPPRPHPGAQLTLFETRDGWRYSLWATNFERSLILSKLRPMGRDGRHDTFSRRVTSRESMV